MEQKNEIWKDIEGYEGIYQVSNLGRVRTIHGEIKHQSTNRDGYNQVSLTKGGKTTSHGIHRLVALSFVDGYEPELVVNHKNEIKNDNRAANLEWCTRSYNTTYNDSQRKGRDKTTTRTPIDEKRKSLGSQLRELRKIAGMSVYNAAQIAGISESYLNRIESGVTTYSFDTLESVCNVYGKTLIISQIDR